MHTLTSDLWLSYILNTYSAYDHYFIMNKTYPYLIQLSMKVLVKGHGP